jgi:hypothetical protein
MDGQFFGQHFGGEVAAVREHPDHVAQGGDVTLRSRPRSPAPRACGAPICT